jgi:pimeloyl-ACP methyl ester carboxylesterase
MDWCMTNFVKSADGTRIAYDRHGSGPLVVLVGGMLSHRLAFQEEVEQLATRFTVLNYDRRGRGESDTPPYAREREVDDLAALIEAEGGSAMVYGRSSGAGLALNAAASGLPITRLVLFEPPYGPDDEDSKQAARELAENVGAAIAQDRRADAIAIFLPATGMSREMAEELSQDPAMQAMAPTMLYDFEVMGYTHEGAAIPSHAVQSIDIPTLLLAGEASPSFLRDTASQIVRLLPDGELTVLRGADHDASAEVVGPVITEFFSR